MISQRHLNWLKIEFSYWISFFQVAALARARQRKGNFELLGLFWKTEHIIKKFTQKVYMKISLQWHTLDHPASLSLPYRTYWTTSGLVIDSRFSVSWFVIRRDLAGQINDPSSGSLLCNLRLLTVRTIFGNHQVSSF